jgi:Fic family protein
MKPDWDESSPKLASNLRKVLKQAEAHAAARKPVSVDNMRLWHGAMMTGLNMPDPGWAGCFRGQGAAQRVGVSIGAHSGVAPEKVEAELEDFERRLVLAVARLDSDIGVHGSDTPDHIRAVIDLCAWAHGEWVRIHPFANGSGRTARLWVNYLAMRYGLPPFARLRPRPDAGYGAAAGASMTGNWKAMAPVFHAMLADALQP